MLLNRRSESLRRHPGQVSLEINLGNYLVFHSYLGSPGTRETATRSPAIIIVDYNHQLISFFNSCMLDPVSPKKILKSVLI